MKEPKISGHSVRLASLDVLRGFDMFWIIGGASIFRSLDQALNTPLTNALAMQFEHVDWEGFHFYDLIWPLFMFIVGVAIPLSIEKRRAAGASDRDLLTHAIARAAILFVLGMIAQGNLLAFDLSILYPCYSVLHGIAAGYLIATVVALKLKPNQIPFVIGGFLLIYWVLLVVIPVPGYGMGVLTEQGNAATYIDQLILGRFHFGTNTWFLSYLGFSSSVLLGVLAGHTLRSERNTQGKLVWLTIVGGSTLLLGLVWSLAFPVIKLLWTSSFVLVAGGISFLMMAFFYLIIDVLGLRRWAFAFIVIGMNPIAAYMATMLFDFRQIGNIFIGNLIPHLGVWGGVVESLAAFVVVWLILLWMYRTRSFLKI